MHKHNKVKSRARCRANGEHADFEGAELEESKDEVNDFQDLQLGSITPVVRDEEDPL